MRILFSHTIRSIRHNKAQFAVIVITIAVVTALFFASLSLGDIFYNFQLLNKSRISGLTDIEIKGDIFSEREIENFCVDKNVEYIDYYLSMPGLLKESAKKSEGESDIVLIEATDLKVFSERNKNRLTYRDGIKDVDACRYPGVWISKGLADKRGFNVGDEINVYLTLYQRYQTFNITYVFENEGIFANSTVYNVLVDINQIGNKGLYNLAYVKMVNGEGKDEFIYDFNSEIGTETLKASEAIDYEYIKNLVASNERLLSVALIFVIALVVFILYSAYLVFAKNRATELSIFKSAGAAPGQLVGILLFEGVFCGVCGAAIGVIFGRFVMQIVVRLVIPGFTEAVTFGFVKYLYAILLGVTVSLLGALVPAINLYRDSVRKLNSSNIKITKKFNPWLNLCPLLIMVSGILLLKFLSGGSIVFILIMVLGVALCLLTATPWIVEIASKFFGLLRKQTRVAEFSIKRNSATISLTALISAVIVFAFVAVNIVNIIIDASKPFNSRFHSDFVVESLGTGTDLESISDDFKRMYGIKDAIYVNYEEFKDENKKSYYVYAIEGAAALDVLTAGLTDKEKEIFANNERAAVISYDLLNRYGLKVGDKIDLLFGDTVYAYEIVARDETKTANDRVIVINKQGCDYTFGNSIVFVNTSSNVPNGDLYVELQQKLESKNCYILEFADWAYATSVGVNGLGILLRLLEIMIVLVGFMGIINMTISFFIERRNELYIFKAVGADKESFIKILLGESILIGVSAAIIGIISAIAMNFVVPDFARLIDRYISVSAFPLSVLAVPAIVIVLYSICYLIIGVEYSPIKNATKKGVN